MKYTALYQAHQSLGGKMVEFGGYSLPVQYSNIIAEHNNTRKRSSIFDTSHMGKIEIFGKNALNLIQKIVSRDISKMQAGQMMLCVMCNQDGGIIDDLTVYKFSEDKYWLVVNAGTKDKDFLWIREIQQKYQIFDIEFFDRTDEIAKFDLQGPLSWEILKGISDADFSTLPFYYFKTGKIADRKAIVSQSGYTGEYGFEIYANNFDAVKIFSEILKSGKKWGILPAGLGSRDTLRTESGMMLYGNDIDETVTPLECVYSFAISWDKDFIGKDALFMQKNNGLQRKLIGFEMTEKAIARHGYEVYSSNLLIGKVTSGTYSPALNKNIGMAYVPLEYTQINAIIEIKIRENFYKAKVIKLPFYKRK